MCTKLSRCKKNIVFKRHKMGDRKTEEPQAAHGLEPEFRVIEVERKVSCNGEKGHKQRNVGKKKKKNCLP